jgi:hypothetical protein
MDAHTLKQVFGDKAGTAQMVLFQHGTRITDQADFLEPEKCIKVRKGDRGQAKKYRKSQVHPTVWAQAMRSALSCSDMPLMNNDVAVILTGGTPEAIVGALACGYRTVIYIAGQDPEELMMTLPTAVEEASSMVDYAEYFGLLGKTCNNLTATNKKLNNTGSSPFDRENMQAVLVVYVCSPDLVPQIQNLRNSKAFP